MAGTSIYELQIISCSTLSDPPQYQGEKTWHTLIGEKSVQPPPPSNMQLADGVIIAMSHYISLFYRVNVLSEVG